MRLGARQAGEDRTQGRNLTPHPFPAREGVRGWYTSLMIPTGLAQQLSDLLGPGGVSGAPADLRLHAADALRPGRLAPGMAPDATGPQWVVWPRTLDQVQGLVRLANQARTPLVPYGGGTGLMGSAMPVFGGIVVDLTRMAAVRRIDAEDRRVVAEAGAVLSDVDHALQRQGLMLGHDPWTAGVATVGGAISTNSLGYRGGQYGSMGEQVLGLEAVLPDGRVISTRPAPKSSTGPALHHLLIGGEGCFGIVTAATLKAFPQPEQRRFHALQFPDFEAGYRAVEDLFAIGLVPALLEYGEEFAAPTPAGWTDAEVPDGSTELFLVFEGYAEMVAAQERRALVVCRSRRGQPMPESVAREFWDNRHRIAARFAAQRRETGLPPYLQPTESGPIADFVHVALPASRVLEYRRRCLDLAAASGVWVRDCGLWNRPELFSLALVDGAGDAARLYRTANAVIELAQDLGGAMEYCHGVGLRLAHLMGREHGEGLEALRAIKRALDPLGILNPGKLGL